MQRFFDIVLSLIAIIVLIPVFIPVIVLLRFTGEGEIFYRQERIGKNLSSFALLKFATMLKDSPNLGSGTITIKGDPRVLPVGRVLRKTKINELPQLINVLLGDMSLIGPRPLTKQTFDAYDASVATIISEVRPGLSGVGSIIFRNEEELLNKTLDPVNFYFSNIAPIKGKLEVWYVENRSLYTYFLLIFITVIVVLVPNPKIIYKIFPELSKINNPKLS